MGLDAGGRVTGAEVIAEMITELFSSAETGAQFEGEMQRLASYARYGACKSSCLCHSDVVLTAGNASSLAHAQHACQVVLQAGARPVECMLCYGGASGPVKLGRLHAAT